MFNWYYILWSDAINFTRSTSRFIGVWKLHTLGLISFFMALNLLLIRIFLKIEVNTHFITLFNSKDLDNFLGFMVVYFLPPLILNYLLIFSKNQWQGIRKKYKSYNGKIYKMYFIFSLAIPVSLLIIFKLAQDFFEFTI